MVNREMQDVVTIVGGGLAGMCLALQLRRAAPALQVVVLERRGEPPPRAAFKIGESSVEIGSHYFLRVLELEDELRQQLPKYGLRFFFTSGDNRELGARLELGPSRPSAHPSFHIDRGSFEQALRERCARAGVDLRLGCKVTEIEQGPPWRVRYQLDGGSQRHVLTARWVVDASGRAEVLKRRLDLRQNNRHNIVSAWLRVDRPYEFDEWSADADFARRNSIPRRLSTTHLVGPGYWMWFIPLADDRTSVGVVADAQRHPFDELRSRARLQRWLARHEPQYAELCTRDAARELDFVPFKNVSYDARQVLSDEGWFLTGDASRFLDPLYSPGNDFIALNNTYIVDLITRALRGEDTRERAARWEGDFRNFYLGFLPVFQRQYSVLGRARVMSLKIMWDFAVYWGFLSQLFLNGRTTDTRFMNEARPLLRELAGLNASVQRLLRQWASAGRADDAPRGFIDYLSIPFLQELNTSLVQPTDAPGVLARLQRNLALLKTLQGGLLTASGRASSGPSPWRAGHPWAPAFERAGLTPVTP